jgi:hypothetical protein
MRRPQLHLRTLLIAVAIAGLAAGVVALRQRSAEFRARAAFHAGEERKHRATADLFRQIEAYGEARQKGIEAGTDDYVRYLKPSASALANLQQHATEAFEFGRREGLSEEATASYHATLKRKYEHAALYPWLPVEPDPPEPQ